MKFTIAKLWLILLLLPSLSSADYLILKYGFYMNGVIYTGQTVNDNQRYYIFKEEDKETPFQINEQLIKQMVSEQPVLDGLTQLTVNDLPNYLSMAAISNKEQPKPQRVEKRKDSGLTDTRKSTFQSVPPQLLHKRKDPAVAATLAIFMPIGHIYAGEAGRGFAFMMGTMASLLLGLAVAPAVFPDAGWGVLPIAGAFTLPMYIWSSKDAYSIVQKYNAQLESENTLSLQPTDAGMKLVYKIKF